MSIFKKLQSFSILRPISVMIIYSLFVLSSTALGQFNWEKASVPPLKQRSQFGSIVYDNKLWILNGFYENNSIYYTSDGMEWKCATVTLPYKIECLYGCAAFTGYMWLIGGKEGA